MNTEIKCNLWLTLYRRTLNKWALKYFKVCILFFVFNDSLPLHMSFLLPSMSSLSLFPLLLLYWTMRVSPQCCLCDIHVTLHLILPLQSWFHTGSVLTDIGNERRPYFSPASPGALSFANLPHALLIRSANGWLVGLDIFHYFSSTYSSVLPS